MTHSSIQLLAVTPATKPFESVLGYVLRVSEANGYESPWAIMRHAGINQNQMIKATTPVEPIAHIVGRPVEELKKLPWQRYPNGEATPALNRGAPRLLRHLNIAAPKICPHCVAERGIAEAAWDLKYMVACPVHRVSMTAHCSSCRKPLTWYRPGIDTCRCGAHTASDNEAVPRRVVALLSIVRDSLYGNTELLADDEACGLPQADLRRMHVDDLLSLMEKVGNIVERIKTDSRRRRSVCTVQEVDDIAAVFENWPAGFHALLKEANAGQDGNRGTVSLRKRFEWIYCRLFGRTTRSDGCFEFMRKAFIDFGMTKGNGIFVDARMLARFGLSENYSQVVRMSEFARRLVVHRSTAIKFAERGLVTQVEPAAKPRRTSIVFEVNEDTPIKDSAGGLRIRAAARHLDIPVRLLNGLRQVGVYRARHFARTFDQYHRADLNEMRRTIVNQLPLIPSDPRSDCITIDKAIRSHLGFRGDLAHLIADIVAGQVKPLGRTGDRIRDLVLKQSDWLDYQVKQNLAANGWIPGDRVARLFHCASACIVTLIESGHLEGVSAQRSIRVKMKSAATFAQEYASGAWIAKLLGTSSRRIQRLCKEEGMKTILAERGAGGSAQLFVARSDLEKLGIRSMPLFDDGSAPVEIIDQFKMQATRRSVSIEKLQRYLDGMKESSTPLPRRAGQPNRAAIANACGFDRNVLYMNAEVAVLLDAFDTEDRARHNIRQREVPAILLTEYLEQLKKAGVQPPRRAGQLNRKAIAKACGLDRKLLYSDANARILIETINADNHGCRHWSPTRAV